MKVRRK